MPVGSNSASLAIAAAARDAARLHGAIADFFLPDDARLDERTRRSLDAALVDLVAAVEADLRRHAARLLAGRGADDAAEALLAGGGAMARLTEAGVLRDADLMDEMIARVRGALIADALPAADAEPGRPSLLVRLADHDDGVVSAAAQALLAAESRRAGSARDLPAELQHRLVWWVAAAVRDPHADDPATDRALAGAAHRCLAAADEGERAIATAVRLAVALDPLPAELPALLVEALGDRRLTLFVALLARALGVDGDVASTLVLEPDGERLWPALRAIGLERHDIARIALSLSDADPRRDIEAFADRLDAIAALEPATARALLEPLALPRDFRLAIAALAGRPA